MPLFKDKMTDWYAVSNKETKGTGIKPDKNFPKHMIKPCSMISIVGSTGAGKSTALVEFLSRKDNSFCEIIIFSGSTGDEPLLNLLKTHIEGIQIIDDVDDLPELTKYNDEEKGVERLMVFDDFINLPKKQLVKIQKWFNSARKYGFTCICMAQNYTDIPIQMRRNTMYWILFRLNDINTINNILKNHNNNGDDKNAVKSAYFVSTRDSKNFFVLDLTANSPARYRHNFTDVIQL